MVGQGVEWFKVKGFEGGTTSGHFKALKRGRYGHMGIHWGHIGHVRIRVRVYGDGFRVEGLGLRVPGLGFRADRVCGLGSRA